MNDLIMEGKKDSLEIICKSDGNISLTGNSILPNALKFFQPVYDWITEYLKTPAENTVVTLKIEYIDTSSVQALFDMLKMLREMPEYEDRLMVNWYFEYDDPELLEVGEIMEGRLKIKFNYIEHNLG